jgi:hypothetical protein
MIRTLRRWDSPMGKQLSGNGDDDTSITSLSPDLQPRMKVKRTHLDVQQQFIQYF